VVYEICEQICQFLIESLLQIEEGNLSVSPVKTPILKNLKPLNSTETKKPSKLESIFTLLNLFCKISPQLLVSHAETLQPYLKSQVFDELYCFSFVFLRSILFVLFCMFPFAFKDEEMILLIIITSNHLCLFSPFS
jgi:hypothetical protein